MDWRVQWPLAFTHTRPFWKPPSNWLSPHFVLLLLILFTAVAASGRISSERNVLIINEVGISHPLTALITQQILMGVHETFGQQVEIYSESLDLISPRKSPSRAEIRDWLVRKYGGYNLDVVVAVGPDSINFLKAYNRSILPGVPIVICGSAVEMAGNPMLDSRFTGTWLKLEPAKTVKLALQLFPDTRHVVVVGGASSFDRIAESVTRKDIGALPAKVDLTFLTDLSMGKLLERLGQLPERTIILYLSFFEDATGNQFVNATQALPAIVEAANAPVFGMSDTYLGRGIVGGSVMSFQEQGKITAQIISELLNGKTAQEIPIARYSSVPMFDWRVLHRWHIPESSLPAGSIVLFREPSLWERARWIWMTSLLIVLGLSVLAIYLQHGRKQLKLAKDRQLQLSGMLITAQETERSRLAAELHDDFSQRLALLALGLENAAEAITVSPQEADRRLHELLNSASEIGADLHTLSHRLHSSTLESLGLVSGISSFCKEFQAQQGIQVGFRSENIPRRAPPDASLCLFRIVQEALRNCKKYSGASSVQVSLERTGDALHVVISDEGVGFNPKELSDKPGLGVRSMEERARLLGGRFEIRSQPGKGTVLKAWVPIKPISGLDKN